MTQPPKTVDAAAMPDPIQEAIWFIQGGARKTAAEIVAGLRAYAATAPTPAAFQEFKKALCAIARLPSSLL